ncbi:protein phosphatase 2 (formerly 2A), regulatory subunit B'' [Anopheles darlingi]|uniref:Protein phosphatase 2 (Formerly 2A), regulatory subunit B n=1 Tax=Anopheles darlingi TaxID=43151 RepID=W5JRA7_ANODA|nr:protein phosphatase 2 (formerly 2A), regulatory subunit B'' [Anopheles darlingi]
MATAAKQSSSSSSTFVSEGQEDLDAIAKQISDHAEAIYQTWKARGLAPTEILNCHTGDGEHAFSQTLNPANPTSPVASISVPHLAGSPVTSGTGSPGHHASLSSPVSVGSPSSAAAAGGGVAELLAKAPNLSNNSLEQLVSSFVNEDKARIAAQRQQRAGGTIRSPSPSGTSSAVKSVLQKFERNGGGSGPESVVSGSSTTTTASAGYLRPAAPPTSLTSIKPLSNNNNNNNNNSFSTLNKNSNNNAGVVPDVLRDTIAEPIAKPVREKPQTPVKPEHLLNHVPSWPLKNRVVKTGTTPTKGSSGSSSGSHLIIGGGGGGGIGGFAKNTAELMDEVSREEERLINALKTGTVLNSSDSILPEVITSTLPPDRDVPDYASATAGLSGGVGASGSGSSSSSSSSSVGYSSSQPAPSSGTMVTAAAMATNGGGPLAMATTNGNGTALNGNGTATNGNGVHNHNNGASAADAPSVKHWNGVPMKPNHIPILNIHQIREQEKLSMNFTRNVATTRLPKDFGRSGSDDAEKKLGQPKTIPSPIRPFLSRGSVAERVLIFEKCPEKAPPRERAKEPVKLQSKPVNRLIPPNIHTTLQRHLKNSTKAPYIPQFHFPNGKPPPTITTETTMQRLEQVFDSLPNYECSREKFHMIVTMCQVPLYWRLPLFMCTQLTPSGAVDGDKFLQFWRQMTSACHDAASRFVYIMSRGDRTRPYILPEDFAPLIQDVVDTHPGLAFLKEAAEFHSRYVHTVIARIFYNVNRSWTGKISTTELRKSNLLDVIQLLEEEEDINQIMAYFSYEHFYVIYCKFWELDRDHDLYIDQQDLARHNDHALSSRMIERIFSGCVTRSPRRGNNNPMIQGPNGPKMSYTDFVWFLLAEEDKSHPTAIEYWFRCMDVDGDGALSMYELEYFYEEQQHRMESLGIETLPFEDCLCQMLDMIKPATPGCVTLADLKRCKMTPIFFDTFFNLEKYMEHEQRDPFAQRENDDLSDWDRYAAQEYELLVAEEGGDTQGEEETR